MDCSQEIEDDLDGLSPFDLNWGIELPRQQDAVPEPEYDAPRVDEDDYTDEEAQIFKIVKDKMRTACNVNTTWSRRKKALDWCFVRGEQDSNGIDFHTACLALGARPDVMQARLHHQLYVAGIPLREPMSIWIDRLPEQYESEAIMAAWEDGIVLVREVWRWPGIPMGVLEERSGLVNPFEVMQKLEKAGLLAWRFGYVFLTGRSPDRAKRRNFSWSRSFF